MNDKRPVIAKEDDDFISSNPDGAIKGLALLFIAIGFLSFIIKFNNEPKPLITKQNIPKTEATGNQTAPTTNELNDPVKDYWAINGTIGDYVGGIAGTLFSLSGFALLYLTFKKQTEANTTQLKAYNHDKVEGRFFELLRLHRDNVNELKFTLHYNEDKFENGQNVKVRVPVIFENRHFFVAILDQFKTAYNELDHMFNNWPEEEIYSASYLKTLKENQTLIERNIDLVKYAKIDLVYLIVFFGLSKEGQATIKSLVESKYDSLFVNKLLTIAALKPKYDSSYWHKWGNLQRAVNSVEVADEIILAHEGKHENVNEIFCVIKIDEITRPIKGFYPNHFEKYYGGHQFRLGHYFRHIFHTISFINDNHELSPTEQYNYVKHLRGQLSTNEQILVFLNSISQLGRVWELEDKKTGTAVVRWKQIMSDYMVIKNIPNDEHIAGIRISEFYPNIVYEGFEVVKTS